MSVAQLSQHVAKHLEELHGRHVVIDAYLIFRIHIVPVEAIFLLLVVEETVTLVEYLPERLEVTCGSVVALLSIYAGY